MQPHEHAGNLTLTAALWGLIGAKLFHWLENPDELAAFVNAPGEAACSAGSPMYGRLIVGGGMVLRYMARNRDPGRAPTPPRRA